MSSQTQCRGLEIQQDQLVPCSNQCRNKYCEDHEEKYSLEKPEDCAICMEHVYEQTETPLECGHWFHKQCLVKTNKYNCPMCRQSMYPYEIDYIFGSNKNPFDVSQDNGINELIRDIEIVFISSNQNDQNPFITLRDNDINAIIRDIEISPRNNPFVNVASMMNTLNDPERLISSITYMIDYLNNHGTINVFADDIIRIMSIEDLRLFSIGINLECGPSPNFYLRMVTLMVNRIEEICGFFQ